MGRVKDGEDQDTIQTVNQLLGVVKSSGNRVGESLENLASTIGLLKAKHSEDSDDEEVLARLQSEVVAASVDRINSLGSGRKQIAIDIVEEIWRGIKPLVKV